MTKNQPGYFPQYHFPESYAMDDYWADLTYLEKISIILKSFLTENVDTVSNIILNFDADSEIVVLCDKSSSIHLIHEAPSNIHPTLVFDSYI